MFGISREFLRTVKVAVDDGSKDRIKLAALEDAARLDLNLEASEEGAIYVPRGTNKGFWVRGHRMEPSRGEVVCH